MDGVALVQHEEPLEGAHRSKSDPRARGSNPVYSWAPRQTESRAPWHHRGTTLIERLSTMLMIRCGPGKGRCATE
jgi:hypothetical protein